MLKGFSLSLFPSRLPLSSQKREARKQWWLDMKVNLFGWLFVSGIIGVVWLSYRGQVAVSLLLIIRFYVCP